MLVRANGVEIDAKTFGPIGNSAVMLIADADQPGHWWPPALIDRLVAAGVGVVTFDHRDIGRSSRVGDAYDLADMANDVCGLARALELETVGLLGFGMGGTIALHAALCEPALVDRLVVVAASPGRTDEDLPLPDQQFSVAMAHRYLQPEPASREERVGWLLERCELLAGRRYPFEEERTVVEAAREVDRAWQPASGHGDAVVATESLRLRLDEVAQPTLVVHGTADPVYPVEHGQVLARRPNARLLLVEELGHELPTGLVEEFGDEIVAHLTGSTPGP